MQFQVARFSISVEVSFASKSHLDKKLSSLKIEKKKFEKMVFDKDLKRLRRKCDKAKIRKIVRSFFEGLVEAARAQWLSG